jgi:glycosyltransferase involved in cell wall biosynthesis
LHVVLATTAPDVGGVARHVFDLATGLEELGHKVVLASRGDAGPLVRAGRARRLAWQPLSRSIVASAQLWHLHLHNSLDLRALPLLATRRALARGGVILTEHLPRTPRTEFTFPANLPADIPRGVPKPGAAVLKPRFKRSEYRLADKVIAVSHASAEFMVRRWDVDPRRLVTIHNGVSVPLDPAPPCDHRPSMRVVTIAQLQWLKGVDVLLDAAALAAEPWTVRIIGDGPARGALEQQASLLGLGDRVEFTGWRADAPQASIEADVVCAPSRAESFSYTILEAMACARPVVASAVDGAEEAIRDGRDGMLVPPEDPERLASALDSLARDPARRAGMGRTAYERVGTEFQLTRMVAETAALYERVLARHS